MRRTSTVLNVLGLLVAAPLLGYSLAHSGPGSFATATESMLAGASVGMSAAVAPNPYNGVAQQLNAKEAELEDREAALKSKSGLSDSFGLYSFIMSIVLLILIVMNFYFDTRRRRAPSTQYAIDLPE